jgi:hypothetical protein
VFYPQKALTDEPCYMINATGEKIPLNHICDSDNQDDQVVEQPLDLNDFSIEEEIERIGSIDYNAAIGRQQIEQIIEATQQNPEEGISRARESICRAAGYSDLNNCPISEAQILVEDTTP